MNPATWDTIVIGAGPAGSLAASLLARSGASVLLVERHRFPRPKVCGGCLNAKAVASLEQAGLAPRVRALGARPTTHARLRHGSRSAVLSLPPGLAVSRAALDAELAAAAVDGGAVFEPETTALVMDEDESPEDQGWRRVMLQPRRGAASIARARLVLAADGLAHRSLRECRTLRSRQARHARVGIGSVVPGGVIETTAGVITMAISRHGYVGAVEVEDGQVSVAAAIDGAFLRTHASAAAAVAAVLGDAGVRIGRGLGNADWSGTIPLTQRMPRPAARRVFVLGDAAGYVEPFTGEGVAWAFASAEAVVPLARHAIAGWHDDLERAWADAYARRVRRDQRVCRAVTRVIRVRAAVTPLVVLLHHWPALARPLLARLAPRRLEP